MSDFTVKINGYTLEYYDEQHLYLVNGVIVPSVTQMLRARFGNKYDGISRAVLQRASEAGTQVHEAIERYCHGEESDLPEVRNFKFLQKQYKFQVLQNEVPVILFDDDLPVCAGRLDMVIEMDGKTGLADIKRTSALDKEYLAWQLNLYRIAYKQCYDQEIYFLKGIWLRNDTRKFVDIPINEVFANTIIRNYTEGT